MEVSTEIKSLKEKYGKIIDAEIIYYHKYRFIIRVKTDTDQTLQFETGGSASDIYDYDPFGDWDQHVYANSVEGGLLISEFKNKKN
jgi:hypothetical protein